MVFRFLQSQLRLFARAGVPEDEQQMRFVVPGEGAERADEPDFPAKGGCEMEFPALILPGRQGFFGKLQQPGTAPGFQPPEILLQELGHGGIEDLRRRLVGQNTWAGRLVGQDAAGGESDDFLIEVKRLFQLLFVIQPGGLSCFAHGISVL